MADPTPIPITQLPLAGTLTGSEIFPLVQGGVTKQSPISSLLGAPATATFVTMSPDATLVNERTLAAGTNITITDSGPGGAVTIASTGGGGGGAPVDGSYVVMAPVTGLSDERTLTAGAGITIADTGANGTVTVSATAANASFLTLGTSAGLSDERVLTAGLNVTFTDTGPNGTLTVDSSGGGYINIPQNVQSANYTTVLSDQGKHIYHPQTDTVARTFTIPTNASVPYQLGTTITFVNHPSAGVLTIAFADFAFMAGTGIQGNRTLPGAGVATALKVKTQEWVISGPGLV